MDAHTEDHFNLRALLFVTTNDWPALSNLLGFLGVYGKAKDILEARQDLQRMKQWAALHPEKGINDVII